ncbi:MAG: hypothetical protein DRR08_11930 [Candidatus Parabeggiatoa sp. nov. 2]|nr:MAG: hypothetical protein B6247_04400 [Beggiatoa sp. 4572_84]RKZ60190.1 MAG: hypothetical protein DRR08_11930 [Gammaproteobacteria bacterium]
MSRSIRISPPFFDHFPASFEGFLAPPPDQTHTVPLGRKANAVKFLKPVSNSFLKAPARRLTVYSKPLKVGAFWPETAIGGSLPEG